MSDAPAPLLSAKELAPLIGMTTPTGDKVVLRWHREGRIPAAIAEPNFVRFDLVEVREALAKRAKERQKRRRGPW